MVDLNIFNPCYSVPMLYRIKQYVQEGETGYWRISMGGQAQYNVMVSQTILILLQSNIQCCAARNRQVACKAYLISLWSSTMFHNGGGLRVWQARRSDMLDMRQCRIQCFEHTIHLARYWMYGKRIMIRTFDTQTSKLTKNFESCLWYFNLEPNYPRKEVQPCQTHCHLTPA